MTGPVGQKCPECGITESAEDTLFRLRLLRAASAVLLLTIPAFVAFAEINTRENFLPLERIPAMIFIVVAAACALVIASNGYHRYQRWLGTCCIAGALFPLIQLSARDFNIANAPTIVRVDLLWQVIVWGGRVFFALTLACGIFGLSQSLRRRGIASRFLLSNLAFIAIGLILLLAVLVAPWGQQAIWDAARSHWPSSSPNSGAAPRVPNLVGVSYLIDLARLFTIHASLLWLWVLALLTFAASGLRPERSYEP